ncbi:MAG: hypothetical protein NTY37_01285 [Methanothrix sp.]|nr:hypothetical protein [Methanothrix sp.]
MPSPNLRNKFWQIICLKLYMASLIVALLALDLIIILIMAGFTHFLIIGIGYLGMTDEGAIQVILRISNAIYIIIYLFFAVLFVHTTAREVKDIIKNEQEKS